MESKQVKDLMEANPGLISPDATLEEAARKMKELDCGFLPVGSEKNPEGILTDRDIVVRAVAEGKDIRQEKVRDYMTTDICACKETDSLEEAAKLMSEKNISRLVVKDKADKLCGVLTFGRMIRSNDNRQETTNLVDMATGKAVFA